MSARATELPVFCDSRWRCFFRAFPVYQLSLQKYFASTRRNLMIGLVLGFPIIGTFLGIVSGRTYFGQATFLESFVFFAYFYYSSLVGVVVLLFLAVSLTSEEFSNKTIVYFLHSPVRRTDVFVWKYLAYVTFALSLFIPTITAFYVLFAQFIDPEFIVQYQDMLFGALFVSICAILMWGSVFFLISLLVPKFPMIWGLTVGLVDFFLANTFFEGLLGAYSLAYHIKAVAADLLGLRSVLAGFSPVMSTQDSYFVILFYVLLFALLAGYRFNQREVI